MKEIMVDFSVEQIEVLSQEFESKTPQAILVWAVENFGPSVAMSSSFQTQSVPLLHMVSQIHADMRIFFLNTQLHFWESLIFREQLQHDWNLNVADLYPDPKWKMFLRQFGLGLDMDDPDLCCFLRKVQPMQQALDGLRAWISGIRRDQTAERAQAKILEYQEEDGLLKINPMLNWTRRDVWRYINEHTLPEHPLLEQGFTSIGCVPCTRPVVSGDDERSGRWGGRGKTECGLHTAMFNQKDYASGDLIQTFGKQENNDPEQGEE